MCFNQIREVIIYSTTAGLIREKRAFFFLFNVRSNYTYSVLKNIHTERPYKSLRGNGDHVNLSPSQWPIKGKTRYRSKIIWEVNDCFGNRLDPEKRCIY